jgi:hypothetical protein
MAVSAVRGRRSQAAPACAGVNQSPFHQDLSKSMANEDNGTIEGICTLTLSESSAIRLLARENIQSVFRSPGDVRLSAL